MVVLTIGSPEVPHQTKAVMPRRKVFALTLMELLPAMATITLLDTAKPHVISGQRCLQTPGATIDGAEQQGPTTDGWHDHARAHEARLLRTCCRAASSLLANSNTVRRSVRTKTCLMGEGTLNSTS